MAAPVQRDEDVVLRVAVVALAAFDAMDLQVEVRTAWCTVAARSRRRDENTDRESGSTDEYRHEQQVTPARH